MTDNEIIKALVRCTSIHTSTTCFDCPYSAIQSPLVHFGEAFCKDALLRNSLNLITRQKGELDDLKRDVIPKLQHSLERANKYGIDTDKENQQLRAKIERLKEKELWDMPPMGGFHDD